MDEAGRMFESNFAMRKFEEKKPKIHLDLHERCNHKHFNSSLQPVYGRFKM